MFTWIALVFLISAIAMQGQVCSHVGDPQYYVDHKYLVRSVAISSPFDFVAAIRSREREESQGLLLRPGIPFTNSAYSGGIGVIKEHFPLPGTQSPLKLRVIVPSLKNCDETGAHKVDVVYKVFLSNPLDYLHRPAEFTQSEIERPFTTAANAHAVGRFALSLTAGYNRVVDISGGGSVRLSLPKSLGALQAEILESAAAHNERLTYATSKQLHESEVDTLNVRLGFEHSDVPTGSGRVKFGHLFAQAFATSKDSISGNIGFRYGLALEGGNEQSSAIAVDVVPQTVASASYAAAKAYTGVTFHGENYAVAASYGLQAASDENISNLSFLKHVGHMSFAAQVPIEKLESPGRVHRPINIEWELSGGFLQRLGIVPVTQRFFGGNASQQFIAGDEWKIPSGPFIRSIPQNRLNAFDTLGSPVGGSSFWSTNTTLSLPVWGYPLIPKELARDPSFEPAIAAEKVAAKNALMLTYQKDLPAFKTLVEHLPPLDRELSQLQSFLTILQGTLPSAAMASFRLAKSAADSAARVSAEVQASMPQAAGALIAGPLSRLTKLSTFLDALAMTLITAGRESDSNLVRDHRNRILSLQSSLASDLQQVDLTVPEKRAVEDLKVVDPVLNSLLHKLNIVSVSPVAVFDIARLWPDKFGTRYGPGTGIRLGLVTLNVTLGYAWNVHGAKNEGPGAMFFSLDVSNIFR